MQTKTVAQARRDHPISGFVQTYFVIVGGIVGQRFGFAVGERLPDSEFSMQRFFGREEISRVARQGLQVIDYEEGVARELSFHSSRHIDSKQMKVFASIK